MGLDTITDNKTLIQKTTHIFVPQFTHSDLLNVIATK